MKSTDCSSLTHLVESPLECLLACADAGDRALEHHGGIPNGEALNARGMTTDALGSNHSGTGTKTDAELRIGSSRFPESSHP